MPYVNQNRSWQGPLYSSVTKRAYGPTVWLSGPAVPLGIETVIESVYSYRTNKTDLREGSDYEELSGRELARTVGDFHRTKYDNGHEFASAKRFGDFSSKLMSLSTFNPEPFTRHYTGPLWMGIYDTDYYPVLTIPTLNERMVDGNRAISASAPTKPEAALAVFLGELREKIPAMVGIRAAKAGSYTEAVKAAGDEHLNVQFGIKPFINDLEKLARSVKNFSQVVRQLDRDSSRFVRRRRQLSDVAWNVEHPALQGSLNMFTISGNQQEMSDYIPSGQSLVLAKNESFQDRSWFSGAFSYHLSDMVGFMGRLSRYEEYADILLGTRITPSTVWEITPWSWLFDWNLDVGSFLSTLELFGTNNLVLRYGYVMHEQRATRHYTSAFPKLDNSGRDVGSLWTSYTTVSKIRTRALPYGFVINTDGYSTQQWAILGALGMTKSPTNLRNDE